MRPAPAHAAREYRGGVWERGLWNVQAGSPSSRMRSIDLALNARDAMPDGGKLTIETANVLLDDAAMPAGTGGCSTGSYVMIAVTDTGCGMHAEQRSAPSSPSSRPSPGGQGTGLGLEPGRWFVKQSGGHVRSTASSATARASRSICRGSARAEDQGARPKTRDEASGGTANACWWSRTTRRAAATVEMLPELGYRVLEAEAATELADRHSGAPIELLSPMS